ncbi:hypothetical protein LOK55_03280 [Microbacterium sp. F2E]|uniref:hypothetical protein n=1 Tax=Microbacterium sp. F2E TaxID=2895284 RepID=UPI001E3047CE|nr:hypothetical protein [Microbacterium sp. F2E]MCC9053339.1 hypothetical protein [Microbacterium sp. F2E]
MTAKTATIGLTQASAVTPLGITYSDSVRSAAGSLTLQNTGSRAATYSVTLAASARLPRSRRPVRSRPGRQ